MLSDVLANILDLSVTIQQIPAPTFHEERRTAFIQELFLQEDLVDVSVDEIGNVYGCFPGMGNLSPVVVSAHTDTVFPLSVDLKPSYDGAKIYGPGIGDNSVGVASLLGLIWCLKERSAERGKLQKPSCSNLCGDVWVIANVGEEGLGDLSGMRAVIDRFGNSPTAYIILEGMALGQVYHRGLGVRRYRITAQTQGGHSWVDFGRPSAITEIAKFINHLISIPIPERPRTTLNVGVIHGGTSVNTIAPEASIELDLRSESKQVLSTLVAQVEMFVNKSNRPEIGFSYEVIGDRPVGEISPDHPLIRLAKQSLEGVGIEPCLNIGSTDANIPLSLGLPAVCLGLTTGGGAHTVDEYINTKPLEQGIKQLIAVVEGMLVNEAEDI
jgi:acetylornithine deacetylase/succinyl-diaminopimelate desuccinylase-like protein